MVSFDSDLIFIQSRIGCDELLVVDYLYWALTEVKKIREYGKKSDEITVIKWISDTDKFTILNAGSGDYFIQMIAE